MKPNFIIDTGFLVTLINKKEYYHEWVKQKLAKITAPLLTCEPVITESCFLLRNIYGGEAAIMGLIEKKKIIIPFNLETEITQVKKLMTIYQSVPMSLDRRGGKTAKKSSNKILQLMIRFAHHQHRIGGQWQIMIKTYAIN